MEAKKIDELMKVVEPSSIPLDKPAAPEVQPVNLYHATSLLWQQKSEERLADYKYGWNLGKFGNAKFESMTDLFKQLGDSLTNIIANECTKKNISPELFKLHLQMLRDILSIIARDIDARKVPGLGPEALVAALQGFINSYVEAVVRRR